MLGFSPLGTRSAATIEEITATLPETARRGIFSKLDELTRNWLPLSWKPANRFQSDAGVQRTPMVTSLLGRPR